MGWIWLQNSGKLKLESVRHNEPYSGQIHYVYQCTCEGFMKNHLRYKGTNKSITTSEVEVLYLN